MHGPRLTELFCPVFWQANELLEALGQKVAVAGAAAALSLGAMAPAPAMASEFDILSEPTPTSSYFIDDADVLSRSTRSEVNTRLKALEVRRAGVRRRCRSVCNLAWPMST